VHGGEQNMLSFNILISNIFSEDFVVDFDNYEKYRKGAI
jgi:hypothetical protein